MRRWQVDSTGDGFVPEVEKVNSGDVLDVCLEGQFSDQYHSQVADSSALGVGQESMC